MRPVLSVIIPTRNRAETLRRTLAAWRAHNASETFEVVVVDDGSEDGTPGVLTEASAQDPRVRAFRQEASGPATARNVALAHAAGDLILFTGDDIRPAPGLIDGHVEAHRAAGASRFILGRTEWDDERPVTPVMRHIAGFGGQQFRYDYLRDRERLGFKYFYGSNLSTLRATLGEAAGPFDATFRGAALEDADLGYRLMGGRRDIGYRASLVALHDHPYDVRGFAARQRRVGQATAAFAAKHPEAAGEFGWSVVSAAIGAARTRDRNASLDDIGMVEDLLLAALHDARDRDHRILDRLYAGLFWYFQARGIAEGRVEDGDLPGVLGRLMRDALACPLRTAVRSHGNIFTGEAGGHLALVSARLSDLAGPVDAATHLRQELAARAREWRYALLTGRSGGPSRSTGTA